MRSFDRTLAALNRSHNTRDTYANALKSLLRFLDAQGMPQAIGAVSREHIEAFLADLLSRRSAQTALVYYGAMAVFFNWAIEEGEISASPMAHVRRPHVPEKLPPVIPDDAVIRLLRTCSGHDFEDRRDAAIIRLFLDTGMRCSELSGLALEDIDLDEGTAGVMGKGRRPRLCAFGIKTAQAIDRYLRLRPHHLYADSVKLWLGPRGPLSTWGVAAMVRRRGDEAKIEGLHPHLFRHKFAHSFLAAGGQETDLRSLAGWRSSSMLQRYAASAASERARAAHRKLKIGDRY